MQEKKVLTHILKKNPKLIVYYGREFPNFLRLQIGFEIVCYLIDINTYLRTRM